MTRLRWLVQKEYRQESSIEIGRIHTAHVGSDQAPSQTDGTWWDIWGADAMEGLQMKVMCHEHDLIAEAKIGGRRMQIASK